MTEDGRHVVIFKDGNNALLVDPRHPTHVASASQVWWGGQAFSFQQVAALKAVGATWEIRKLNTCRFAAISIYCDTAVIR